MPTLSDDLGYVRTGIQELEDYLLSRELFWPLSGGKDPPRLTLGGLLLSCVRLQARATSLKKAADLHQMELALGEIRVKWPAAWERKATQEVQARTGLWRDYLRDYQQSPDQPADVYPHEVHGRVMLHLLEKEFKNPLPDFGILDVLDQVVKAAWLPGAFIWDRDLVHGFPEAEYWFLYGKLRSREERSVHG